jgi:hypothetical protein
VKGVFWSLPESGSSAHLRHLRSRITSSRISVGGGRIWPPSLSCGSSSGESERGSREVGRKKRGANVGELEGGEEEEERWGIQRTPEEVGASG